MIKLSAAATYCADTFKPLCLAVFAQGPGDELKSFSARAGLTLLIDDWNGQPLSAAEVMLKDDPKAFEKAMSLLSIFDQMGRQVEWLKDYLPDMPTRSVVVNTFPTRESFIKALKNV